MQGWGFTIEFAVSGLFPAESPLKSTMTHSPQSQELSGETREKIRSIGDQFAIRGKLTDVREIKSGHINSTYRTSYLRPRGDTNRYIF